MPRGELVRVQPKRRLRAKRELHAPSNRPLRYGETSGWGLCSTGPKGERPRIARETSISEDLCCVASGCERSRRGLRAQKVSYLRPATGHSIIRSGGTSGWRVLQDRAQKQTPPYRQTSISEDLCRVASECERNQRGF